MPNLIRVLNEQITDPRKRKEYCMAEIVMAAIFMFIFKEGSRNAFNNELKHVAFLKNYHSLLGLCAPHLDTVERVLREVNPEELEKVKAGLIHELLKKKVFQKFDGLEGCHLVAIDATGVYTFDHPPAGQPKGLYKTSSNGVTSYVYHVLEAKIVTPNGMVFSIGSEWMTNEEKEDYQKQDCEHSAFKRLAAKLKAEYPQLPIVIVADGLYPNQSFMKICKANGWHFITTFKDGNLPCLQEEIRSHLTHQLHEHKQGRGANSNQHFSWINDLSHKGHTVHWMDCQINVKATNKQEDKQSQFTFITDMRISADSVDKLCIAGRARWKIENEGFNTQKNNGYELCHKYSRTSFKAMQNYYLSLQIAHMINQFVERSKLVVELATLSKLTIQHIWEKILRSALAGWLLNVTEVTALKEKHWRISIYQPCT